MQADSVFPKQGCVIDALKRPPSATDLVCKDSSRLYNPRTQHTMNKSQDHILPASEEYLSKVLLQGSDQTLSSARDVLKRKILQATLQRAIEELGSPATIAEMAVAELSDSSDVFREASQAAHEQLVDLVARRSVEDLNDAAVIAKEAVERVDDDTEAFRQAKALLKERLIDAVARRSADELDNPEVAAEQAMGRLYEMQGLDEELDVLVRARTATRNRLIGMVARRSMEDLEDPEATADQAMERIDESNATLSDAKAALKGRLINAIVHHSTDELGGAEAAAEQAMSRVYDNNATIQDARSIVKERLLQTILEQALQEINEEVGRSGEEGLDLFASTASSEASAEIFDVEDAEDVSSEEAPEMPEAEAAEETDVEAADESESNEGEPEEDAPEEDHEEEAVSYEAQETDSEELPYKGHEMGDGMLEHGAAFDVDAAPLDQDEPSESDLGDDAMTSEDPSDVQEEEDAGEMHRYRYNYEGDYYEEEAEEASGDGHAVAEVDFDEEGQAFNEDATPALNFENDYLAEAGFATEEAPATVAEEVEAGEMVFVPSHDDNTVQAEATGEAPIFYVYGVVPSEQELPADLMPSTGLDEAFAPYIVRHGAMNVILSKLSARTFSTEALQENLKDKNWKNEYKSRHYHVLDSVMAAEYDLIPMPFGTIYSDEQRVQEMLNGRKGYLEEVLQRLKDRREWKIEIYRDAARLNEVFEHDSSVDDFISELPELIANGFREGMTSSTDEDSRVILENCANYSHQTLRTFADENILKTFQVDGGQEENWTVMSALYLVHEEQEQPFQDALKRLEDKYADIGFTYEATGPRAPLSFCE